MALTPQDSKAFMREVDDAVREERLLGFWRQYGRWVAGVIVIGLLGLAAFLYWQHHSSQQSQAVSESMDKLVTIAVGGGTPDVKELDALAKASQPGFKAAARLVQAGTAARKGDGKAAIAAYKAMVADSSLDQPYRDLALVRQTALEYESLKPQDIVDRLKPLAVEGAPWFGSAGEMVAVAYMKMRKPDLAGPMFATMAKDETVPESIRSRARQMAGLLGVDAVEAPTEPAEG